MNKCTLWWIVIGFSMLSCTPRIETEAQLYRWMNDPANGLVQTKKANDLTITVKYLPPAFLAYKELKHMPGAGKKEMDSLLHYYQSSRTFLMTIKPDVVAGASGDVIYKGIGNYQQYQQRVMQLNFNLGEYIGMRVGKQTWQPALATMENTYGITEQRSLYLVFSDTGEQRGLIQGNELDLTFQDEIFDTGISHFIFEKTQIDYLPTITPLMNPSLL